MRYAVRAWPRSVAAAVVAVLLGGLLIAAGLRFLAGAAVSVAVIAAVGWVLAVSALFAMAAVRAYRALGFLFALDTSGRSGPAPEAHTPGNVPFPPSGAAAGPRPQEPPGPSGPPEEESEVWE
ncbi:hypothetical protein DEJ50_00930 [Streptomyces venezuelae]|uniref:Uncharacterized protein n=1 Tax=Streptomyces venezuelae TaxID=54571 RepID=A0A5P2CUM7_STRVZ|nr:hypothetical protein [Streptomyces venezuelae]QES46624.1 hypothetical protein DEJ50_00930 [Streptomyces venezuelae]